MFYSSHTQSNSTQVGASLQLGQQPTGVLTYSTTRGASDQMTPNAIVLRPRFHSARVGCKRWDYGITGSYRTEMTYSFPHEAMFWYDASNENKTPSHLLAEIETNFRLKAPYSVRRLKGSLQRSHIRNITMTLEARIKRSKPEDHFKFPAANKTVSDISASVMFDGWNVGTGLPFTGSKPGSKECDAESDFYYVAK